MAVGDWLADELSLSSLGWNVEARVMGVPSRRGEHLVLAQRDGVVPRLNRPSNQGEFGLSMWVIGCNPDGSIPATSTLRRAQFDANLAAILRIFTEDSRLIEFKRVIPAGTNKTCQALLSESIALETMMASQRGKFQALFIVPATYWQDEASSTAPGTAGATLPKTVPLTLLAGGTGTIDDGVATVIGPITNPRITVQETGAWVQYSGSLISTDNWVVDSKNFTSKKNGSSVLAQTSHAGTARLLSIPPRYGQTNLPTLVLSGTGGGATTNLSVTAYKKWLHP